MKRRFKYVNQWVTKTGITYVKFRRPGFPSISLPTPAGSPEFMAAYYVALEATGNADVPAVRALKKQFEREYRKPRQQSPGDTGVYLLIWRGKLVYVGSSHNMPQRVNGHRNNGRPFDKAFYISTPENDRLQLERILIEALNPSQNRVGRNPFTNHAARLPHGL